MGFRRFTVWIGTKAAKIGDFGHLNFTFGHWNMSICPYELIFHAHIEKKNNTRTFCFMKKTNLSNRIEEN